MTLSVTKEQAQYLAALSQQAEAARQQLAHAVQLLTLGHVPPGTVLQAIDTEAATLTFVTPGPRAD